MGRGRRFTSYQDYEKALSKGVGIGHAENYQPWFRAQDVKSNGNRSVIFGLTTRRKHHFLSSIESDFFYLAEFNDSVVDIREQFPLFPLSLTRQIAEYIGVQHPLVKGIPGKDSSVLNVMTTDFVLTMRKADGSFRYKAVAVKPDKLIPAREAEKLEIERLFWTLLGVDFQIYVGSKQNKIQSKNICWATSAIRMDPDCYESLPYDHVLSVLRPGDYPVDELLDLLAEVLRIEKDEAMIMLQVIIAKKLIRVDLTYPIIEVGLLRVLSNAYDVRASANEHC